MKKSIISGIVALVAVTGAAAIGTKYTGSQVNSVLGQADDFLLNQYGIQSQTTILDKSLLSSSVQTIIDITPSTEGQGGIQLIYDYEVTNGPLGASYEGVVDVINEGESIFYAEKNIPKPTIEGSIGMFSSDAELRLEAFEINDRQNKIEIMEDIVLNIDSKNDFSAFEGDFIIPNIKAIRKYAPEDNIILKNARIKFNQDGNWMEQIEDFGSYTIISIETFETPRLSLKNAELMQDYSLNDGILDFDASLSLDNFRRSPYVSGEINGSANIGISLGGINIEPFIPLALEYQEINAREQKLLYQGKIPLEGYLRNSTALIDYFLFENEADIMKAASKMLETSNIKLEIKPSYIETDSMGKTEFNGFARLDTRDINIDELMLAKENPMFLISHADKLEAEVSIEGLPASLSMFTGGETVIKAEIKNGVATVNENVLFDANQLGQMGLMK